MRSHCLRLPASTKCYLASDISVLFTDLLASLDLVIERLKSTCLEKSFLCQTRSLLSLEPLVLGQDHNRHFFFDVLSLNVRHSDQNLLTNVDNRCYRQSD
jgi:hypothetical protein